MMPGQAALMPRQMRIEYAGAIYHVMSRGDRREAIFQDEGDRHDFLKTLAEVCAKTGFAVHAYCLMKNHFHLVIETPKGNLVAGMRWLFFFEEELKRLRWSQADLSHRAKNDPGKLALASRQRRETTLTVQEIADRLWMGSRKSVAPKLHAWMKAHE